jgi:AraC-like DNA-binding protein
MSIYADVSSDLGIAMRDATRSHGPFSVLTDQVGERLAVVGSTVRELTTDVVAEIALAFGNPTAHEPDPALAQITRVLSDAMRRGATPSRADLATAVGLSESRFSHWFRERAGMSMQTYRKWQRLALAVERILDGEPMASAAHLAGFADQAHFIRTFRGMFGINPLAALGARHAP